MVVSFGMSAYLKLVCLPDRPQRTEIKKRVVGRGDSSYDFHRGMRLLSRQLIRRSASLEMVLLKADSFSNIPERKAAKAALEQLSNWLGYQHGERLIFPPQTFSSEGEYFKVTFTPDLGLVVDGRSCAIHIWNTKTPLLDERLTRFALEPFQELYSDIAPAPSDLGVLNLQDGRLIRLSESIQPAGSGRALADRIDRVFESVEDEINKRHDGDSPDIRPGGPPPR